MASRVPSMAARIRLSTSITAARRTGRFCQVGFMKRFSEPYVLAKGIAARPEFGRLSVYESRKARNAPYPPVYDFLNDFVCHHLDLARYFMGEKAVGSIITLTTRSTNGPFFSLSANTRRRSGSARNCWKHRVRSS